jgi:hypothetical protein
MALFTFDEARLAYREWRSAEPWLLTKSAQQIVLGEALGFERRRFDVFLSHSHLDSEVVLGICRILRSWEVETRTKRRVFICFHSLRSWRSDLQGFLSRAVKIEKVTI